jgi:hypothetical protein
MAVASANMRKADVNKTCVFTRLAPMAAIIIGVLTLLVTAAALVFQIYVWKESRKKENRLR